MRTLLAILFVALLVAAPLAIAERGSDKSRADDDDRRHRGAEIASNESDDNETEDESEDESDDDANATRRHRDGRGDSDARRADAESVKANRTAILDGILERLHALRASWLENATAIRESCHAQTLDDNATQEDRTAASHCIRDGYAEWRAERRAEMKELRAELRALFDHRGRSASD